MHSIFSSLASSVMMVKRVASDPVPAVVGMAKTGRPGRSCACGAFSARTARRTASGSAGMPDSTAIALAVSIGLPPPNPITQSAPALKSAA